MFGANPYLRPVGSGVCGITAAELAACSEARSGTATNGGEPVAPFAQAQPPGRTECLATDAAPPPATGSGTVYSVGSCRQRQACSLHQSG